MRKNKYIRLLTILLITIIATILVCNIYRNYENNKLNDRDFSIENMFKLTGGSIDYNTAMELYSKAYYFAKAKLRTISSFACFDSASATAYFSSSLLISLVA